MFLQGCLYYPRQIRPVEEKCETVSKEWVLDHTEVNLRGFGSCSNDGCLALLVGIGAVVATTVVVSGSVVVVGNTVYWLEKRGKCPPMI